MEPLIYVQYRLKTFYNVTLRFEVTFIFLLIYYTCLFVFWFVALLPGQHMKVMSSAVSYPIHTIPGQAS